MKQELRLERSLKHIAMVRTTLETQGMFPTDDPIHGAMQEILQAARTDLAHSLQELHDGVQRDPDAFDMDYAAFRRHALDLMAKGHPGRDLNLLIRHTLFDEGESSLYYFEATGMVDIETMREMPAHQLVQLCLRTVLYAALCQAYYADMTIFDRQVYRKFAILMFLVYHATDSALLLKQVSESRGSVGDGPQ